jgi:hypothetical protein
LFHEAKKLGFVGPFKKAGFTDYQPEPIMKNVEGETGEPDLVSWNKNGDWLAIELTLRMESKNTKLTIYSTLDPRYLADYGVSGIVSGPDVIVSRIESFDDGPFCRILVNDLLKVEGEERLRNDALRTELKKAENSDLRRLPSIPISLLPESKGNELRRGIVDQILQLFESSSQGATPEQIVDNALERLADRVRVERKGRLVKRVRDELDSLAGKELALYIEADESGVYRARPSLNVDHHATRLRVSQILESWAGTPVPYHTPRIDSYEG